MAIGTVAHRVFWADGLGKQVQQTELRDGASFDVVVVGGGFTGLWAAWHLTQRQPDLRVLVAEASQIGAGASGRNAGYLVPHFSASYSELNRLPDHAAAAALAQAGMANLREVIALVRQLGIDCDLADADIVTAASHPGFDGRIARDLHAMQELGISQTPLTAADLRAMLATPVLTSGYSCPGGTVNPFKLLHGLAGALRDRGVAFAEGTRVHDIERQGDRLVLRTSRGELSAGRVVAGRNAWAAQDRRFRRQVLPIYTYLAVTRPLTPGELDALEWHGRAAFSDRRSILLNFRLTPDDRILFGGRDIAQPFAGRISARLDSNGRILKLMRESFDYVFPGLGHVPFEVAWGGPIALTPQHLPRVGTCLDGLAAYAHGCGGHGVTQSHLWSAMAVDLLFGEVTERTRLPLANGPDGRYPLEPARFLGGIATTRQLRRYDDTIQSGRKADREAPLFALINRILSR